MVAAAAAAAGMAVVAAAAVGVAVVAAATVGVAVVAAAAAGVAAVAAGVPAVLLNIEVAAVVALVVAARDDVGDIITVVPEKIIKEN